MNLFRVVIADPDARSRNRIKGFLNKAGYLVIGEARDGISALTLFRSTIPDLIILDAKLPTMDPWEIARILEHDRLAPVIMIMDYGQHVSRVAEFKLVTPVLKPITESNLLVQVQLALARYKQIRDMETEIDELKESLEARKLVEKAKGILMNNRGMSEQDAFRHIQQTSMNKRLSKRAVAEAIILAASIE